MSQRRRTIRSGSHALGRALLAVVVTALGLTACGAPGSSEPGTSDLTALEGGSWVLESGTVDGEAVDVPDTPDVTLTIAREDGAARISGRVCNSYGGELAGWPDAVAIEDLFSTEMACEQPGLMDLESLVLGALPRVSAITGDLAGLTTTGDGVELVWTAAGPADQESSATPTDAAPDEALTGALADLALVEGRDWALRSGAVDGVPLVVPEGLVVTFGVGRDDEGALHLGGHVCNWWTRPFVQTDDVYTSTAMSCGDSLDTLETAVMSALSRADSAVVADGVLTLTGHGVDVVWDERPPLDLTGVLDVTWTVRSVAEPGEEAVPVSQTVTWLLRSGGTYESIAECSVLTGTWTDGGTSVRFGSWNVEQTCGDSEPPDPQSATAQGLSEFTTALVDGTLTITSDSGSVLTLTTDR